MYTKNLKGFILFYPFIHFHIKLLLLKVIEAIFEADSITFRENNVFVSVFIFVSNSLRL